MYLVIPLEINLPTGIAIVEPDHSNYSDLSHHEIVDILKGNELSELITGDESLLLIINDHHRSTPTGRILGAIYELYPENNIDLIMIATGTHDSPSKEEIFELTGGYHQKMDIDIAVHDAISSEFTMLGTTSRGTEMKVNSILMKYKQVLCINSVEPHYFAGFTGGIKSIVPGLAAKSTIEKNHSWALSKDTGPALIENNPLHQDLWEVVGMMDIDLYGIQLVNFQSKIYHVNFGKLKEAFLQAVDISKAIYCKRIENKVDIIVSVIYPPLDKSLYQAQKGIENTRHVLKEGGEMILLAKCENGIGNDAFYRTLKGFDKPDEVLSALTRENYSFGDHKAYNFASLASKSTIYLVSDLSISECRNVFARSMLLEDLEYYLMTTSKNGKSILVALDTGSLSLFTD